MKKLTLFLVAMFAMINVANAQRAWAYDLELTPSGDSYTFAFKAVTAGDATLVFYKEGVEAGTLNLGSVSAGDNTVTKTSEELLEAIQQSGNFTWGVKMTGSAIAAVAEVTDQSRGIYDFYNMMGVVVDNDPESENFSMIYIQQSLNGDSDGSSTRADNQKAGVFIYDQGLNELNNPSNVGIKPTLPTGYTMGDSRNKFHRLNIHPITGDLVYSYNISGSPAVFAINRDNMTSAVTNLLDGITGFTQTCAHCFDAEGTLYVMDLASSKGTIYKIKDGIKTKLTTTTNKFVNASMTMVSDGRGGLWVAQNRGQIDSETPYYYQLVHVAKDGTFDWVVDYNTTHGFTGSSTRGALAYDVERQILAQGRNGKVELYNVTYDATTGLPTVTPFKTVSSTYLGTNIDGLAFDYAGDLYVVNSSKEKFQKFAVPTNNNTCTVPAKKSQVIKLESITLNAHPVKDYSASIVGTMKRAIQNGENTIVLTHEDDGTPHIYNIAHTTKTVTEISQEGVNAAADGFLSISDIAVTEDGKLVACNYVHCTYTASNTSYFYIWDDIASTPRVWFTSQKSGNYNDAYMGYTMALKGTSLDAEVTISAFNKSNSNTRYSHLYVVDGTYTDADYKYSRDNVALHPTTLGKSTYELNASPLAAGKWIVDGELASPIEFVEKNAVAIDTYTALNTNILGKKYNGASYLFHNDHHLMIAPYAADDKLAGVKVLGITDGFDAANLVITNTDLANTIDATSAAATAYVDGDGDLTIYLIADGKVYTFSEKVLTIHHINAHADHTTHGYVTGGGNYYEGEEVTLKAVAKSAYYFTQWNDGNTDNPRTITVDGDKEYIAEFAEAHPRAWAYDMKLGEEGDNYKFSFTATTAANATLLFLDKEGNELYPAHDIGAVVAGANTVSIEKAYFTQVKDVYWSVKMDGEAITAVAEITDQSRGIYDFYSTLGVTVDNNPNSEYFGKIYVQATLTGDTDGKTPRAKEQTAGLFIYNQLLDELNPTSNVGIQPSLPSGYSIGDTYQFNRLAIDPTTNNITYCYAISGQPAVFSMDRADLTGTPANLLAGQSGITRSVAHCFDTDGALYVMDLPGSGTIYKIKDGVKTQLTETTNKFVNPNITMTSDGRDGLWVSQNRGQMDGSPYYYQLAHVTSAGAIDWAVNQQTPHGFEGSSSRGALAYDAERNILAQGRNGKVELYTVNYEPAIELTPLYTIASDDLGNNIDGLAFDYAGDLYVVNSSKEKFQKFTLPTAENICTVSAPESQVIIKEVRYTVTVNTVGNGTAIGAGEYVAGETATFKASPAANHQFVNWTYESETSTDNPLELVVNSDITVTANFAPVQYTLIAPTNDEDKGTVVGAGTYNYGTEVTLTATPAAGYKLLYWSDRSTENPRTITMTKNEAISAYFVKEYTEEPTFKIEKVWENTQVPGSADGYQAVGWNGNIYMQNKTAGKIKVYTNDTDAAVDYATSNTSGQQIAVDEAGNLIVFNAYFASETPNAIQIYQKGSTTAKAINFTLPNPGRCDFLSASGDIYSAEGGYVYFYCQSTTVVNRVKIANGELVSVDVVGNNITAGNSQNHVMVDIFGNLVAHSRSAVINATINVHTNESMPFALIDHKYSTLGGCSFELGGKELWAYNVGTTHYNSEWNLYNMTDKVFMSNETLYAKDKVSKKELGSSNWLNVQVVDENTAYIYQFCPEVAVAVWKVTCTTEKTVTIDENTDNTTALGSYDGDVVTATVTRSFGPNKYLTLTLPFDMNDTQIRNVFGNATVYALYNVVEYNAEEVHLQFSPVSTITAGTPYILATAAGGYDAEDGFTIEGVAIDLSLKPVTSGGVTMVPVLDAGGTLDQSDEYFLSGNALYCAGTYPRTILGLRAYFESTSPLPIRARVVFQDNAATSIPMVETQPANQVRKVLKDGQLIIIRGEEMYNMQGQRME